ncbi:MAG: hypothetical protein ABI411_08470 [Tahibacter sp.]
MKLPQRIRRTGLAASLLALIAAATAPTNALAQANVDVNITIGNGITLLYYYSVLDITIDTTSLATLLTSGCALNSIPGPPIVSSYNCNRGNGGTPAMSATGSAVTATFAAPAPAAGGVDLTAVPLILANVWSVRAVGGNSTSTAVQVARGADNTLVNGAASIAINNSYGIAVGPTATLTGASPQVTTPAFADPGLATPVNGSVALSLNLSGATLSGAYSSTSGNVNYVLSVTGT